MTADSTAVYPIVGLSLLGVAVLARAAAQVILRHRGRPLRLRPTLVAAAVLVLLTAVFDNLMIAADLFWYSPETLSGVRLGLAPVEDFSYPLAVAIGLPAVWALLGGPSVSDSAGGGEP